VAAAFAFTLDEVSHRGGGALVERELHAIGVLPPVHERPLHQPVDLAEPVRELGSIQRAAIRERSPERRIDCVVVVHGTSLQVELNFKSRPSFVTSTSSLLPIGEVARRVGMRPSAVRYYERVGLLQPAPRAGGQRRYAPAALHRLSAIRLAQRAGFSLDEIKRVFEAERRPGGAGWRTLVKDKLREVRARIDEAQVMEKMLLESLACGCEAFDECPLIEVPTG
jgi:MerR family redox-sensitive transcriptional activator SoxR